MCAAEKKKIHLLLSLTLIRTIEYIKKRQIHFVNSKLIGFKNRHLYLESVYKIKEERDLGGYYTVARR